MQDGWKERYMTVCYNIQIAEMFIKRAEQGGIPPDISQRTCLIIVANALWSAVEVFNKRVASSVEEKFTSKKGTGNSAHTEDWFQEHEPLVDDFRNGAVHADRPPSGVGKTFTPGSPAPESTTFVWSKMGTTDYEEIPIDGALSRLRKVADQIRDHVFGKTKTGCIIFA